mgnify:CR=1 FL=1
MRLRKHRETLDESMETVVEIPANMQALLAVVQANLGPVPKESIHVTPYCFDARINWDTHIVTVDGYGVYGFTDSPLTPPK